MVIFSDIDTLNGYNQVNYRRCKNIRYGESSDQAEQLDDMEAVVCPKCYVVHKDSQKTHQCCEYIDSSQCITYYE